MENAKKYGSDLTEGHLLKQLIIFMLPMLASNIIQQLYNTVDMIVIGRYVGSEGTVGVATGGQIAMFLTMVAFGMAIGGQVYISQLWGAKQKDKINEAVGTLLSFTLLLSVIFMIAGLFLVDSFVNLMQTPAEAIQETRDYMRITFFGFPFIFSYSALCAVLRGMGDSKKPLLFVTIAAITNVILDIILVAVFDMGAAGTAIATVIGQAVSAIFAVVFLYVNRENFAFDFKPESFKIRGEHLKIFLKLGLPEIVRSICIQGTVIYVNSLINGYGLVASATNSVGNKISQFANTITMSMNMACSSMIGQNLAAGKHDRASEIVYTGWKFSAILALVNCALAVLIPRQIFGIFSTDPAVIEFGVTFMKVSLIVFVLSAFMGPPQAMVTGSGFASLGLIVGILDGVVFRLLFSWLFAGVFDMGVVGYFLASALGRLGPCIICGWYFLSGKWKTRKLLVSRRPSEQSDAVESAE